MTTRFWVRGSQLRSSDFPAGTPLNHFFQWNEKSWSPDRRYVVACDLYRLLTAFGTDAAAAAKAVAHLALRPMIFARRKDQILVADEAVPLAGSDSDMIGDAAVRAAEQTVERLVASLGSSDSSVHAGVFAAFEELAEQDRPRCLGAAAATAETRAAPAAAAANPDYSAERARRFRAGARPCRRHSAASSR